MKATFTQLAAFGAVAQAGSVGKGAEALLVSQPAVSKQIRQIEQVLDTKLFERNARGVSLTPAGEVLAEYTRRIFSLADEAEQAVDDLQHLRRGRLAIAASPMIGTYLLPELLVRFRRRFPAIELRVEIEQGELLQRRLADGELNFGLSEVAPARDEIVGVPFMQDRLIAIAPRGHPLLRKRAIALKEFLAEPFIARETGSTTKSTVERMLAGRGLTVTPAFSLASTEAIKRAVVAGLGVAIVSSLSAAPEIEARRLVELRVAGLNLRRPLYHLRLRSKHQTKAATAFLCMLDHAGRGTKWWRDVPSRAKPVA